MAVLYNETVCEGCRGDYLCRELGSNPTQSAHGGEGGKWAPDAAVIMLYHVADQSVHIITLVCTIQSEFLIILRKQVSCKAVLPREFLIMQTLPITS